MIDELFSPLRVSSVDTDTPCVFAIAHSVSPLATVWVFDALPVDAGGVDAAGFDAAGAEAGAVVPAESASF